MVNTATHPLVKTKLKAERLKDSQAATEGGCREGLAKHLQEGNTEFDQNYFQIKTSSSQ